MEHLVDPLHVNHGHAILDGDNGAGRLTVATPRHCRPDEAANWRLIAKVVARSPSMWRRG